MHDPYDLHPNDKKEMSKSKLNKSIEFLEVKKIFDKKMKKIKSIKTPTWGYNVENIAAFFHDVITEIEKKANENDS